MKLSSKPLRATLVAIGLGIICSVHAQAPSPSVSEGPDLQYFVGDWEMQGRFRFTASGDWLATRSTMSANLVLDAKVIVRNIEAPQIGLKATDTISFDQTTGVIQYLYQTNREPNALVFAGRCTDESCNTLEMFRVCAARKQPGCAARTTISIESDRRFVARDYQNKGEQEYMSREVVYERKPHDRDK